MLFPDDEPMTFGAKILTLIIVGVLLGVLILWAGYKHPGLKCKATHSTEQCRPSPSASKDVTR
jgi:hypothetical protein